MRIEIIGRGPITSAQLDEILFGTPTISKKNSLKEEIDKLINEIKHGEAKPIVFDSLGEIVEEIKKGDIEKYGSKPICFDIQSITANHKKNAFTVVWADGSHTIIHLQKGDVWDDEKALAMCFIKHMMGDTGSFNDIFTTEMPAKIKHIGKVEPVEKECGCDGTCTECKCENPTNAFGINKQTATELGEAATKANVALKDMINALTDEPIKVQRYDLFLMDPCGDKTEIYHQGTDEEITEAYTERSHGKTGYVLICTQCYSQKAV